MTDPSVFAFDDVYRRFGDQDVLRGLSFRVQPGEIYALLGRNASGKTTALRILLGFLAPHRGRSSVCGKGSRRLSPRDRERIGYVAEGHRLYPIWRVRDAVAFEDATRPRFDKSYADQAIARCGLRPGQFVGLLSRGQRAQLSLVLAVASRPDVLVFDDPAMGLDVVMRCEFLDTMIELLGKRGSSVLFSSHILTDVERIADRVGILHGGRLIVDASLEDLKARVQRRFWRAEGDAAPPELPQVLAARRQPDGYELTLRDVDGEAESALQRGGARLSAPDVPSLEDLFFSLTAGPRDGLGELPDLPQPSEATS